MIGIAFALIIVSIFLETREAKAQSNEPNDEEEPEEEPKAINREDVQKETTAATAATN
jgi:hypothetical protein